MPIRYEEAVPWGRSFDEYQRMFSLSKVDLSRSILGCGDGPAAFNAEMQQRGYRVISCDPIYAFSKAQIESRIDATYDIVITQTRQNQEKFIWEAISSVDALGETRMASMREFLADYDAGKADGRYITAELPALPFDDKSFDLALCSHFLFLYSDNFSQQFHQQSIQELLRVAGEVRVFPVLTANAAVSPYVEPIIANLQAAGFNAALERVPYEFQRGGDQMLRIR